MTQLSSQNTPNNLVLGQLIFYCIFSPVTQKNKFRENTRSLDIKTKDKTLGRSQRTYLSFWRREGYFKQN